MSLSTRVGRKMSTLFSYWVSREKKSARSSRMRAIPSVTNMAEANRTCSLRAASGLISATSNRYPAKKKNGSTAATSRKGFQP